MRSRLKLATAVAAGILSTGLIANRNSFGAIIYTQVAATGLTVPTNANLTYTTAGQPNSDTTETTNQITGETFNTFSTPAINQAGDTAFAAIDSGSANAQTTQTSTLAQNTAALYAQQGGNLVQVAHEGTYAPDRSGNTATASDSTGTFSTFSAINTTTGIFIGSGDVVTDYERVKAYKTSGGSDDSVTPTTMTIALGGIISTKSGSLALLYRQNDSLSGSNINSIAAFSTGPIAVNPSGTVVASMDIGSPSGTNASIVSDSGGTLHYVAQNNAVTPATNTGTGTTFNGSNGYNGSYSPVINASGQTAFKSGLNGTGITTNNNIAIFSQGGGSLHTVVQGYEQVPSTPAGDAFLETGLGNGDMNNAGQTVFSDSLTTNAALGTGDIVTATTSTGTANNGGLFTENAANGISLLARKGNQAFGLPAGTVYSSFNNPVISDTGLIGVEVGLSNMSNTAALTPGTTGAFYTFDQSGNATLIERNGTIAPGTSLYFNNLGINNFAMNAPGELAFESALTSTVGGSTAATGLFAQDYTGTLQLLLETGQSFTIAPGDVSTVSSFTSLSNSGGEDGKLLSWNDNGTVAVDITFANGQQGIYAVSVPEPTSLGLIVVAGCALLGRRNRNGKRSHSLI